jgi:hypothetical protein
VHFYFSNIVILKLYFIQKALHKIIDRTLCYVTIKLKKNDKFLNWFKSFKSIM